MELHYYRGRRPNFGDDLNASLWREVLPSPVWEAPDTVVVGIGSILTGPGLAHLQGSGKRVVVLGTGTSYGGAPTAIEDWHVLAVRGPFTARVIGRPEASATDGAYLVVDAPGVVGPSAPRTDTLFIPHHRTLRDRPWADVAAEAGMTFVSPQWSVEEVFAHFARARLVVTEAMHGAIIADALRIPWVPLQISPELDEFKWRDWLASVDLPFEPVTVPPFDPRDRRRHRRMERELRRWGFDGFHDLEGEPDAAALTSWLDRRYAEETVAAVGNAEFSTPLERGVTALSVLTRSSRTRAETVRTLEQAAASQAFLSRDDVHERCLDQLRSAVERAGALLGAG